MSGVCGVHAVVLTYGTGGQHEALLDSLASEGLDLANVLLVHNPSTPGEDIPVGRGGCEVMTTSHNLGYAAGMNLGIRRKLVGGCEHVLVLTHDARLRPGALAALVDAAGANPYYGVLGPVLLLSGSEMPFSYGGITHRNGDVEHLKSPTAVDRGIAACDWVDGGTMLLRTASLQQAGDFDERFWSYFEDADLCLRISRAGFGVGVVMAAQADQAPGGTNRPGAWAYLLSRNGLAYAHRFAGLRGALFIAGRELASAVTELGRGAARALGIRPGSASERLAVAAGRAMGLLDFLRKRWGPPPARLPGTGDLRNVNPPAQMERTDGK
jgi:GT2 family glycosyltransferase